jgi:hypothetical protein
VVFQLLSSVFCLLGDCFDVLGDGGLSPLTGAMDRAAFHKVLDGEDPH